VKTVKKATKYFDRFPIYRQWPQEDRRITILPNPLVDFDTPVMTIGSCFAEYILVLFSEYRFNVFDPHWGYKYSTLSMLRSIRNALNKKLTSPDAFYKGDRGYTDLHHHRIFDEEPNLALWKVNQIEKLASEMLPQAKVLIITLGQNEVWKNLQKNEYINHPYPGVLDHEKGLEVHFPSVEENAGNLEEIHRLLTENIPDIQIIVTVSPIPLRVTYQNLDAVVGNNMSKYTLYVAATEFSKRHDNVHYFPAFDIVNYEFSDRKKYWAEDGRHLQVNAIQAVLPRFADAFCTKRTQKIILLLAKLDNLKAIRAKMSLLVELEQLGYPRELAQVERAGFYAEAEMHKEAFDTLSQLEIAASSPFIQHQLGSLSLHLGDSDRALGYFEKTLELLEDINSIAFSGARRENNVLYGGNDMYPGVNYYEIRVIRMEKLKETAIEEIGRIREQVQLRPQISHAAIG